MRKAQHENIIVVTAIVFVVLLVAGALYAFICGNHYFTAAEVLAEIQEVNPYAFALERPPTYRIFEPSRVTVKIRNGETEDYLVFSNLKREITVE